ncbi:MAG: DNA recombination protein RmuC [Pseudohongiellaceae bacterium]
MTTNEMIIAGGVILGLCVIALWQWRRSALRGGELAVQQERLQARDLEIQRLTQSLHDAESENKRALDEAMAYRESVTRLESDLKHESTRNEEKLELLTESREKMTLEFKNLANEILEDKSRRFTDSNKTSISEILKPLQEKIQHFEKRVEETYDKESKERFSLGREIQSLLELNHRLSEDAVNLTNALKGDNKAQGTWGEIILETILERSGLVRGREYEIQVSLKAEDGSRSQPDVIVHLPESKDIIIDAKVSLKAYEAFCSEGDAERKAEFLHQHTQSVRGHIKLLAGKDYQKLSGVNTLDFVLLFLPIEAAFSVAVQSDPDLFSSAFEKNILLVGPSTLLATLRIVQNIWRLAQQNENALVIAKQAGGLYDKFVGFLEDLEDIGKKLEATRLTYDKAHNKLHSGRGNLVARVETLKKLGANASKKIDSKLLTAAEADSAAELLGHDIPAEQSANDPPEPADDSIGTDDKKGKTS